MNRLRRWWWRRQNRGKYGKPTRIVEFELPPVGTTITTEGCATDDWKALHPLLLGRLYGLELEDGDILWYRETRNAKNERRILLTVVQFHGVPDELRRDVTDYWVDA